MAIVLERYNDKHRDRIIDLSIRAWTPVFEKFRSAVPTYVYNAFYPKDWQTRQAGDIEELFEDEASAIWMAMDGKRLVGWVGIRIHTKDSMGEIYIIAVDPLRQREGIATLLIEKAFAEMREAGTTMAMV